MAAPKRKKSAPEQRKQEENSDSDDESMQEDDEDVQGSMVQVDFEARTPDDSDFHGIKQLLQQLFLKAHVNLSELTDLVLKQNHVCSVVKQSLLLDEEDDDDDDEDDIDNFAMISIINMTEKKDLECVRHIHTLLLDYCKKNCSEDTFKKFSSILDAESHVGLILSERFINIPPQIALPLYESLGKDMKKAVERKQPFDFAYYLLICKLYKGANKDGEASELIYANAEEELFIEEAEVQFDYSVAGESDSGLGGRWSESDEEWKPHRRVLLIPACKWEMLLEKMRSELSSVA